MIEIFLGSTILGLIAFMQSIKNKINEEKFLKNRNQININNIINQYCLNPDPNRYLILYNKNGVSYKILVKDFIYNNFGDINYIEIINYFTKKYKAKEDLGMCTISLEPIKKNDIIRELPCNHCFKINYIDNWLKKKPNCPLCRKSIII